MRYPRDSSGAVAITATTRPPNPDNGSRPPRIAGLEVHHSNRTRKSRTGIDPALLPYSSSLPSVPAHTPDDVRQHQKHRADARGVLPVHANDGDRHAASRSTAANSSGHDQRVTVDNGSTSRKSSSFQTSAASSISETKVRTPVTPRDGSDRSTRASTCSETLCADARLPVLNLSCAAGGRSTVGDVIVLDRRQRRGARRYCQKLWIGRDQAARPAHRPGPPATMPGVAKASVRFDAAGPCDESPVR